MESFGRSLLILLIAISTFSYAQTDNEIPHDTLGVEQRLNIFQQSLDLEGEDLKVFEKTYVTYYNEQKRAFRCSFLTLDNLAKIAGGVNQAEALECLNTLLVNSDEDKRTRDRYFEFIKREIDPKTADQFMRIELGFDKTYVNLLRRKVLAANFPSDVKPQLISIIERLSHS